MTFKNIISWLLVKSNVGRTAKTRSLEEMALFHWKVLVGALFVLTLFVLANSFIFYRDLGKDEYQDAGKEKLSSGMRAVATGVGQVTLERLEKIDNYFETKSVTFKQVRRDQEYVPDPSR